MYARFDCVGLALAVAVLAEDGAEGLIEAVGGGVFDVAGLDPAVHALLLIEATGAALLDVVVRVAPRDEGEVEDTHDPRRADLMWCSWQWRRVAWRGDGTIVREDERKRQERWVSESDRKRQKAASKRGRTRDRERDKGTRVVDGVECLIATYRLVETNRDGGLTLGSEGLAEELEPDGRLGRSPDECQEEEGGGCAKHV